MPHVKAAQAGRQGPARRCLAEQFAAGKIRTDMAKKEWKLGLPTGQGGFGCIYLAIKNSSKSVGSDVPCVVKVKRKKEIEESTESSVENMKCSNPQTEEATQTHSRTRKRVQK